MDHLKKIILLLTTFILCNDGQGPLFTSIDSYEDFFRGEPIRINIQAMDSDQVDYITLYYRFSPNESYKNLNMEFDINYYSVIPSFEITSNSLEYYFLGIDKHGNQTKYPNNADSKPLIINIEEDVDDYEVYLINPVNNSESNNVSIIVLSLYNNTINEDFKIFIDNKDITNNCNISKDMITYVPSDRLSEGSHKITFDVIRGENIVLSKKFDFKIIKDELPSQSIINSWMEKINYSGSIGYTSDYDKFNYYDKEAIQSDSRPMDIQRINFNIKSKYKQLEIQSSVLFNTHIIDGSARLNKDYKQPIDRIKFGIKFPYGVFNFGDYSTTFSDLTLKGTRVRGLHASIEFRSLKISYIRGKTRELIQSEHWTQLEANNPELPGFTLNNGDFIYYQKGTPSRNLRALRTELNFGKRFNFGISGLTAYDVQDVDIPYTELYSNYLFTGNSVIGSDATLFFNNKRTWLSVETAISLTNDILEENINNYLINDLNMNLTENQQWAIGALEELFGYSITTDLLLAKGDGRGLSIPNPIDTTTTEIVIDKDYIKRIFKEGTYKIKFKSPFSLYNIKFNLQGEYKRIPFNFVSYGSSSIPKDIQGFSSDLRIKLFNNRVIINLGYDNESDNVNQYKLSSTVSKGNDIGVSFNFNNLPIINYSRKYLNRLDNDDLVNNSTITHTFSPSYKFKLSNTRIGLNANLVIMDYHDFLITENVNNDFIQLSFSNAVSLAGKQLSINIGSGYSNNKPDDIEKFGTSFSAFSSKISYKFKNNKLNSYIGFNRVFGESDDITNPIENYKTSIKLGSQYKFSQYSSVQYNIEYLLFADEVELNNNYTELKGKLSVKVNF